MNIVFYSLTKSRNETSDRSFDKLKYEPKLNGRIYCSYTYVHSAFGVAQHVVGATFGHLFSLNN